MWPTDTTDDLIDIPTGANMDDPGYESDVVLAKITDYIEAFIAEFGANPSGASATLAARLDTLVPLTGATGVGPLVMAAGAALTLAGDPSANLEAATKQYLDARVATLFPGGLTLTSPTTGDTIIYNGTGWVNVPSGL